MRLIDANKLHYIRKWFEDSSKSEVVVFAKEIDKAPTVQAIPIEYIKALKEEVRDVTNGKAVIEWLLEDWEKENEQSNIDS